METYSTRKVRKIFQNSFKFKKVICYHNPCDAKTLKIERVNPDHVGILWGKKKNQKHGNYIKFGKVYFSLLPIVMGLSVASWLDALTMYSFNILFNIGLLSVLSGVVCGLIMYFPMYRHLWRVSFG